MSGLDFSMACSGEYAYGDGIDIINPQDGNGQNGDYKGSTLQFSHRIAEARRVLELDAGTIPSRELTLPSPFNR